MFVKYKNQTFKLVKILPDKAIIETPNGWVSYLDLDPTKKYWYVNLELLNKSGIRASE